MHETLMLAVLLLPLRAGAQGGAESPQGTEARIKALEERLSNIESAPAKTSLSAFNPAMGLALDTMLKHGSGKGAFQFRAAEMNLEAPIDPFLKGWAIITGSNGAPALDVEEAALQTTSLPYNLTVTGGRLFASFGRLAHFHDHELPVVDRPRSLDTFIGGEARADGVEVSYLLPAERYVNLVVGAYNQLGAENDRQDNASSRRLDEFTYLGRMSTYQDIGDSHSLELGLDSAWTPKRGVSDNQGLGVNTIRDTWRALSGVDLTYRYQPAQGGLYRGIVWGIEAMRNDERRFDAATRLPLGRRKAYSGFSYLQFKTGRHWRPGVSADLTEDLDRPKELTQTWSAFLTCDVTEFQRLRLAYSRMINNVPGRPGSHTVALQWTGVLGHHVHGFRDR